MEDYRIKSGLAHIRFRAWPCPKCHQPPAVVFNRFSQEFEISCCGHSTENKNTAVVLDLWNDIVKEKTAMMEEKTPIIWQCPICGSILKESVYSNGTLHIRCMNRCINLADEDHARVRNLLQNVDWRSIEKEVNTCPRCGGDKIELCFNSKKFWIHCTNPNCWTIGCGETLAEAIAQWKELACDEPQADTVEEIARREEKMEDKKEKEANSIIAPCPFCGCQEITIAESGKDVYVQCTKCGVNSNFFIGREKSIEFWNRRLEPEKPKVNTVSLSSLKDSDYVWILPGGVFWKAERAKKEFPDWNVRAFLCEIAIPSINFDTFDQAIFDLLDDSEYQFYIGNGEGNYPYYSPETVKQMYDILIAGIREKGQFIKPTDIQVVKD